MLFLNSCKISKKLTFTENDYSNVASGTLLKLFSTVYMFPQILQEFRNDFLKEHFR